jgi:hypothetical protein
MKLRLELIDDHEGSVSYRNIELHSSHGDFSDPDLAFNLNEIVEGMLDSYQKMKQNI